MKQKPIEELIPTEDHEAFALLRQRKISFEEFLEKSKNPQTLEVINAHLISFQFKTLWESINELKKRVESIEKQMKNKTRQML